MNNYLYAPDYPNNLYAPDHPKYLYALDYPNNLYAPDHPKYLYAPDHPNYLIHLVFHIKSLTLCCLILEGNLQTRRTPTKIFLHYNHTTHISRCPVNTVTALCIKFHVNGYHSGHHKTTPDFNIGHEI